MKKVLSIILLAALLATLLVGCADSPQQPQTPPPANPADPPADEPETPADPDDTQDEGPVFLIGINNYGLANFFARIGKDTMESEITRLGHQYTATVTADVLSRTAAIEAMIAQGVDAIIIQEGDIEEVGPALMEAQARGIIIASLGGGDADFLDLYVASDEYDLGRAAAEQLVHFMGEEGRIIEIYHDAAQFIRERRRALHDVVEEHPGISIEWGYIYAWPDFFPDVKSKTESVIQANPNPGDITGVFSVFDGGGVAAASAFREAGLTAHVTIVGIDGDPDAYSEMLLPDSPFKATVAQDPEAMAIQVVQGVIDLLNGEDVPSRIFVPAFVVTKDNIPEH